MAGFVKTRTSDQCRSHHQKVQKLHGSNIDSIVNFYTNKLANAWNKSAKKNVIEQGTKDNDYNSTMKERAYSINKKGGHIIITIDL